MNSTCHDTCCHGCQECWMTSEHLKTKVVHIDEKPVTHSEVQRSALKFSVLASLNPVLFFRLFSATLRAKLKHIYIDESTNLILENLFMQPYRTTKHGKFSLRENTSMLSSTFCDLLKNNLISKVTPVRDKENTSELWQCD